MTDEEHWLLDCGQVGQRRAVRAGLRMIYPYERQGLIGMT